ncbi:hypothetical protein [Phaeobacter inhibens]|uniref:hypothetical protein n=1 Tax=Phaeobacter inhibens TaxID=221822 RepID=UPI0035CD0DE1
MDHDMLCVGCMVSPFHSVSEACAEYHLDEEVFRAALADAVEAAHRRWGLTPVVYPIRRRHCGGISPKPAQRRCHSMDH